MAAHLCWTRLFRNSWKNWVRRIMRTFIWPTEGRWKNFAQSISWRKPMTRMLIVSQPAPCKPSNPISERMFTKLSSFEGIIVRIFTIKRNAPTSWTVRRLQETAESGPIRNRFSGGMVRKHCQTVRSAEGWTSTGRTEGAEKYKILQLQRPRHARRCISVRRKQIYRNRPAFRWTVLSCIWQREPKFPWQKDQNH